MENYFDIKALPNSEVTQSVVMGHLMENLHRLFIHFEGRIGVAFPMYRSNKTLGGIIRVLGSKEDMQALHKRVEQHPMFSDYALTTAVAAIPERIEFHAQYKRHHFKSMSHLNRLKKRRVLQGKVMEAEEAKILEEFKAHKELPRICMQSGSTKRKFMLAILEKRDVKSTAGKFNGYGLGLEGATVPLF